jgi:hypothetical protein
MKPQLPQPTSPSVPRRFRIVYAVDRAGGALRIAAVGHRKQVYDELTEAMRRPRAAQ